MPLPILDEPKSGSLTVQYAPEGTVSENPPRFVFLPPLDESVHYVIEVLAGDGDRPIARYEDVARNFFTPDAALAPGDYRWRYAIWRAGEGVVSTWSRARGFTVPDGAESACLPSSAARAAAADLARPRMWLGPAEATAFADKLALDDDHCGFRGFYQRAVTPYLDRPLPDEPAPYPGHERVATQWRKIYLDCQDALYGVKHVAIAGRLLRRPDLTAQARRTLLALCRWDVDGTTSRRYNDEAAFRVLNALAWGYDWLHDDLSAEERGEVRRVLLIRTRQVADHVMRDARIHVFPYDSHAIRALSAAIVPAAIALAGDAPEAQDWLDWTVEYLFAVYPPWGGRDGGWAEGPHYWCLAMAYLTEAAGLIGKFLGIDLYRRPFFQRTGDFELYTKAPGTRRVCFGDDSTMGDLPSLKVGYLLRTFAGVTSNGHFQWAFERIRADDPGTAHLFYNIGWWSFDFDDVVHANDFPTVAARDPHDLPAVRHFGDVGWVAVQRHMADRERHVQLLFKSSGYGSLSHSHGDHNAFLLRAFGEDLAIQSGYYVAFDSSMHREWRRATRSKNALLIGGRGQYAGQDKSRQMAAKGRITRVESTEAAIVMAGDATAAYAAENPAVERVTRELHWVHDSYIVIVDRVETREPLPVTFLLHAEHAFEIGAETFRLSGHRAGLYGHFVLNSAGRPRLEEVVGFPGVDPADYAGLALHRHVAAQFPAARRHNLVTLLVPYALSAPRRVHHFIDDQGFRSDVYFVDEAERNYRVSVPKDF